ncbi:MAG: wax ester/triacylglycerol synthase family O-acyltransferase [Marinicaulis sp.]|nr:wax ester/triacylglycerol synthase family O-acyltransferase [Marinicaulis sp.]
MEQLSAQDAQFLYMEDADIVANITGAYICDQSTAPGGIVRFRDIVSSIEERLKYCPFFKRKLMRVPMEMDYPYWVDDPHFDIEYHVHHARLPQPADWRQFCIHFARYHSRPLDLGRPLWEMYIVEGLDNVDGIPKGSFAVIGKVHHAVLDGTAAIQMLGALMDISPEGPPIFQYPPTEGPGPAEPLPALLARASLNNARSPMRFADAVRRSSPQIARAVAGFGASRLRREKSAGVPHTIFNDKVSPHKSFDAVEFDLADFKMIRTAYPEAKVNDIVLATVGGGLRKYLKSKDELPKQPLIAMAPINARTDDKSNKDAGNNISAMTVPLFTTIGHPVERLKAVTLATRKTKAAKDGVGARLLTDLSQQVPAAMMALGSRFAAQALSNGMTMNNLIVSNVPGPQVPLYFCGAKMEKMYGMAPLGPGMGLFITTPSYNGKISFGVTCTREIMPDTPEFIACLKKAFAELKTAAEKRLDAGPTVAPEKPAAIEDEGKKAKKKKKKDKKKNKKKNKKNRKIGPNGVVDGVGSA